MRGPSICATYVTVLFSLASSQPFAVACFIPIFARPPPALFEQYRTHNVYSSTRLLYTVHTHLPAHTHSHAHLCRPCERHTPKHAHSHCTPITRIITAEFYYVLLIYLINGEIHLTALRHAHSTYWNCAVKGASRKGFHATIPVPS